MANLISPARNLHGTSVDELVELYSSVRASVREVIKKVEEAAPNGRDYYPLGEGALKTTLSERKRICESLTQVANELLALSDPDYRPGSAECAVIEFAAGFVVAPSITPAIHTNGTSSEELRRCAVDVFKSVQASEEAFRSVVPNGRDYEDSDQWVLARDQHAARVEIVRKVGGYFLKMAMDVKAASAPLTQTVA